MLAETGVSVENNHQRENSIPRTASNVQILVPREETRKRFRDDVLRAELGNNLIIGKVLQLIDAILDQAEHVRNERCNN